MWNSVFKCFFFLLDVSRSMWTFEVLYSFGVILLFCRFLCYYITVNHTGLFVEPEWKWVPQPVFHFANLSYGPNWILCWATFSPWATCLKPLDSTQNETKMNERFQPQQTLPLTNVLCVLSEIISLPKHIFGGLDHDLRPPFLKT